MTNNILSFPVKEDGVDSWRCNCGSFQFFLNLDGSIECAGCNGTSDEMRCFNVYEDQE